MCGTPGGHTLPPLPARAEGIAFHRADGADAAAVAGDLLGFEHRGQDVVEILQFELRDGLANEAFDGAEVFEFFDGHECERVAHLLSATGTADTMNVIF